MAFRNAGYFLRTVTVVLDATGAGSVDATPGDAVGASWELTRMEASGAAPARLEVSKGRIGAPNPVVIDTTIAAHDDTSDTSVKIGPKGALTFTWSGGTPGAAMSCTVVGRYK